MIDIYNDNNKNANYIGRTCLLLLLSYRSNDLLPLLTRAGFRLTSSYHPSLRLHCVYIKSVLCFYYGYGGSTRTGYRFIL